MTRNILRDLKKQSDELRLQLSLGRAEARELLEEHSHDLSAVLAELRGKIGDTTEVGEEKAAVIRGKIDDLRVQIALGKMEGRDAFLEKRNKIKAGFIDLGGELAALPDKAQATTARLGGEVERRGDAFRDRLDALGLNLGLCGIIAEDEMKALKDDLAGRLRSVSDKAGTAVGRAEKKLGHIAGEALDEMEEVLHKLREKLED